MKILSDYHTHTVFSHGKGTIEENVQAARRIGLLEIGISDHGPGHMGFGIDKKRFSEMKKIIDELNQRYDDINILLGLEANVLDVEGHLDVDDEILDLKDILLAGYHFGSRPVKWGRDLLRHGGNWIGEKTGWFQKSLCQINTQALINAMHRYDIDIITHPGAKGPIDIEQVARAAEKTNTALEINASHGYLTESQLEKIIKYDILFSINSDAHHPEDVGRFHPALERAKNLKIEASRILNKVSET